MCVCVRVCVTVCVFKPSIVSVQFTQSQIDRNKIHCRRQHEQIFCRPLLIAVRSLFSLSSPAPLPTPSLLSYYFGLLSGDPIFILEQRVSNFIMTSVDLLGIHLFFFCFVLFFFSFVAFTLGVIKSNVFIVRTRRKPFPTYSDTIQTSFRCRPRS